MDLKVKSKFWIVDERGRPVFGSGRCRILEQIEKLGSIRAAADSLGMSYRAVWGKLRAAEERLEIKLVETFPGGGRNRGARLTPEAREIIAMFHKLHRQGNEQADELFHTIFKGLKF